MELVRKQLAFFTLQLHQIQQGMHLPAPISLRRNFLKPYSWPFSAFLLSYLPFMLPILPPLPALSLSLFGACCLQSLQAAM